MTMTNDELTAAMHELADSGTPGPLDIDKARRTGRRETQRLRLAAVGGSAAAVAAVAVAVTALPGGRSAADGATGGSPGTAVASPTHTYSAPPLDPHDPDVTHWQFGYLPEGLTSVTGEGSRNSTWGTTWAYSADGLGFRIQIDAENDKEPVLVPNTLGGPTGWVPAHVDGARKAFWAGFGPDKPLTLKDLIVHSDNGENYAFLHWQTADGHWLSITGSNVEQRPDWQAQMLKAAAHVVRADRSVPLPVRIGPLPSDFEDFGASLTRFKGAISVNMSARVGKTVITILAFPTGQTQFWENGALVGAPPQAPHTCKDSNGLTMCVAVDGQEPPSLTAIGGRQGLLDRMTSLGTDPANWTTDVVRS